MTTIKNQPIIYDKVTCPKKYFCKLLENKVDEATMSDGSMAMRDKRRIYMECSKGNRKYCSELNKK